MAVETLDLKVLQTTTGADRIYRFNGVYYYAVRARLSEFLYIDDGVKDYLSWFAWVAEPEKEDDEDYVKDWVVCGVRTKRELEFELALDAYPWDRATAYYRYPGELSHEDRVWKL